MVKPSRTILIASSGIYGGTIQLFSVLKNLGIKIIYTSGLSSDALDKGVSPSEKGRAGLDYTVL